MLHHVELYLAGYHNLGYRGNDYRQYTQNSNNCQQLDYGDSSLRSLRSLRPQHRLRRLHPQHPRLRLFPPYRFLNTWCKSDRVLPGCRRGISLSAS